MRLATLAVCALLASGHTVASADESSALQDVIGSQISSFRAKDHAAAFSHAAPNIQLMFRNKEAFARMVRSGYMPIYGAQSFRFGRTKMQGNATAFQEVLLTGPRGRAWKALYTLVRGKDGVWKIAGVRLLPGNEQTT